jgi:plasmid stabilization system protein ParE
MRNKPFQFHPEARADFSDAIAWYRQRNASVATEFRIAVSDVVRDIAQTPQRWPGYLYGTRRFALERFPFSVIYLDDPDIVRIVAVAHAKRKPGYWRQRV